MPFNEPILRSGSLAKRPLIRSLAYLDICGYLGNLGSEFIMAIKISYFFGA